MFKDMPVVEFKWSKCSYCGSEDVSRIRRRFNDSRIQFESYIVCNYCGGETIVPDGIMCDPPIPDDPIIYMETVDKK
jgi:DNA-directed RNA polymerase subunit RPC12/RpoP